MSGVATVLASRPVVVDPKPGMSSYLGRGTSYARSVGRNASTEGVKGQSAGKGYGAEGYTRGNPKSSFKKGQDQDAALGIRGKAGAIDGVTNPKAALTFVDDES